MDYEKKLRKRLYYNITCIIIGIILFVVTIVSAALGREVISAGIGGGLLGSGLYFAIKTKKALKDKESIKEQEILETDERTVMINNRAISIAASIYLTIIGISFIIFHLLNMEQIAYSLAISVLLLIILYAIVYRILEKKN